MRIKFWGVRGSIPHSLDTQGWVTHFESLMRDFFRRGYTGEDEIKKYLNSRHLAEVGGFGVATTCVEVADGEKSILIDGGSGIKAVSDSRSNAGEFHIIISHFHLDHIIGLPFFMPHYLPGVKINYYSVHKETEQIIKSLFKKPMFPVGFGSLSAEIKFHTIEAHKANVINGFQVTPYLTDHPDECYGFKIEKNGKAYSHAVDNEAVRTTAEQLGIDAGLYRNADLLYFDAQYGEADIENRKGWGHGTSHRGFEICSSFGIKQVLFTHHDPAHSIADTLKQKKDTEKIYIEKFSHLELNWDYAYDGLEIDI